MSATASQVVCGWCHAETKPDRCGACGRDPTLPWIQRAQQPPTVAEWRRVNVRRRLDAARRDLGPHATIDQLAERLGVSPRTVRRWQEMAA